MLPSPPPPGILDLHLVMQQMLPWGIYAICVTLLGFWRKVVGKLMGYCCYYYYDDDVLFFDMLFQTYQLH